MQAPLTQQTLEQLPLAAILADRSGTVRAANHLARVLFGRPLDSDTPGQLESLLLLDAGIASDSTDGQPPERCRPPLLNEARRLSESHHLFACNGNGGRVPVELHVDDSKNAEQCDQLLICIRDISGQLNHERTLQIREEIYQGIFDNDLVGLYRTSIATGELVECNDRLAQMFGYDAREEMIARYVAPEHYVRAQDRERLIELLKEKGRIDDFEAPLYRKDGSIRWFRYTGSINVAGGYLEGFVTDVTREHETLKELTLTASVFNGTTESILITDADRRVLRVNEAFSRVTGYPQEEIVGRSTRMLKSGRHNLDFFDRIWRQIQTRDHWSGEIDIRRKDGVIFTAWHNISALRDSDGRISQYIVIFSDITERKEAEERIARLAHYDALTELPNRLLFRDRCDHALSRARQDGHPMAVLFLDLDGFKDINDSLGHPVGDLVLQVVARRISRDIREQDTVARLGGDEFTIVIEELDRPQDASVIAGSLLETIRAPIAVKGHLFHLSASIGISVYPEDGYDATTLVRNADAAMYRAKDQGRNNFQFYTRELTTSAVERVWLENQLREAVDREQLSLQFQPQLRLDSGRPVGVEALLRWQHPERGLIPPDQFIPVAEKCGLILPIGCWVLEQACRQAAQWLTAGIDLGRIAVNVSGAQIQRHDFFDVVQQALDNSGLDPRYLELEVTESFIMTQADEAIRTLEALRDLGITLAIDDFGTGYSSLGYLKRLPIHRLKIDKSFVRDIPEDSNDEAITRAVIALGHSLQLEIIAEGVETEAQQVFLNAENCDEVQGYLYSRPLLPEQIPAFYQRFS